MAKQPCELVSREAERVGQRRDARRLLGQPDGEEAGEEMIVESRVLVGFRGLRGAQGGIALVEHRFVLPYLTRS